MQRLLPRRTEDLTPTRKTLLGRLRDRNDEESWRDFFDTYWRFLYSAAIRSGLSDAEAQDVVQDTVIEVSNKIGAFEHRGRPGSFRSWLMRLAGWRITDHLRKRQSDARIMHGPKPELCFSYDIRNVELVPDPTSLDVARALDEEWELNLLHLAVQRVKTQVDPRQFQIFDLCVIQELAPKKVAEILKLRPEVVYLAKHRVSQAIESETRRLKVAHDGDIGAI